MRVPRQGIVIKGRMAGDRDNRCVLAWARPIDAGSQQALRRGGTCLRADAPLLEPVARVARHSAGAIERTVPRLFFADFAQSELCAAADSESYASLLADTARRCRRRVIE